ncbi:pyruvate formate lyase family protein [Clostridium sp.]|uniref:pyruvate formate lyase family protein n=1 Tax=Clostridium sp. TaxID=1506 RepID=UPI003D6CEEBA
MNNFKVENPRNNLQFEIDFTNAYRDATAKYTNIAQIELACLEAQYPAIMHPIQGEDVLAGRMEMGVVGLGIQGQTGGFGYYINQERVVAALEFQEGNAKYREDLHDILTFWKGKNTYDIVLRNTPKDIKEVLPTEQWKVLPLPASPIIRMAGAFVDFDKLVRIGITGLEEEIKTNITKKLKSGSDVILYESMIGSLKILKNMCILYCSEAKKLAVSAENNERKKQLSDLAVALMNITQKAPTSMLEGLQLIWLYGVMCPLLQFGRLDEQIGDLYVHDIDNKIISEGEALLMVQTYFRLIDSLDSETDGRVIVGGYGRRNPENADRFCLVAIEACRTVKEILPQLTLRFNNETPKLVWENSIRCIEEGRTYPLLYNDEVLVPSVMAAFEVDRKLAEKYMPLGCGEIEFDHFSFGSPNGSMNTLKILELAIRGGYDPMVDSYIAPKTKSLVECKSYEEFLENYKELLTYYAEAEAKFEKYEYEKTGQIHPFMMVSMLYEGCIEKGKGIFSGGCAYLAGTIELYGAVNAADSLATIKKLIFEEKMVTPKQLIEAIDNNFYKNNKLRRMFMDVPKYGNDINYVDTIFVELQNFLCTTIKAQAPKVGLKSYLSVTINNAQNTTLGRWVGATPDGRKSGMPMANANNPAPGNDKNGLTAMFNSILKPSHNNHAGMVQNVRITKETFQDSKEKLLGVIDNYFKRGGAQLMISVVGREDLYNAMKNPSDYKDLIVRVGGFSARFVNLKKDIQKEIYDRVTY